MAKPFLITTENDGSTITAPSIPTNRIFIGNLASELEEFTIYKYCSAYGEITRCQIMKEAKSDRSRGFGFITYAHASSAQAILSARPHYIGHHKINVKTAFPTSESLIQSTVSGNSLNLPATRRLFVSYNTAEADRNNLPEAAIFGYLSAFGVVKEIVQQFSSSSSTFKHNTVNEYWVVEYLEELSIDRCLARGCIQYLSGVRLHLKKAVTEQDLIRRKRQLEQEEAARNDPQSAGHELSSIAPRFSLHTASSSDVAAYNAQLARHPSVKTLLVTPPPPPTATSLGHSSEQPVSIVAQQQSTFCQLTPSIQSGFMSSAEKLLRSYGYAQQNNDSSVSKSKRHRHQ